MRKKILYYCSFLGILFSIGTNSIFVKAESIIPSEKPSVINDETSLSGGLNSSTEKSDDILDALINSEMNNSFAEDEKREGMMTSEEILGHQNVSLSDFENLIISRLLDVVGLFQKVAKPLCIIFFILSAISVVISIVFDTKKAKSGFLGMMLSILAYVGTMYAPELVLFFSQWLAV